MTLQGLDKTRGWIRAAIDCSKKGVSIGARQNHALMLVENPARSLIGKITGCKTADRHGLLNHLLGRWGHAQFESLGLVFPFGGRWLLMRGWHDHSPERLVRHFTVLDKRTAECRGTARLVALVSAGVTSAMISTCMLNGCARTF
jgi:hypothetical protein